MKIILASQSPARAELLKTLGVKDFKIIPSGINEEAQKNEKPRDLAKRLAKEKALKTLEQFSNDELIISADTVASIGTRSLGKASSEGDVQYFLEKLSGRRHKLYTGICVARASDKKLRLRVVKTEIKLKRLSSEEILWYAKTGEGIGKAGGYSIAGKFQALSPMISGQVSNVIGLPLFDLKNMLESFDYRITNLD